MRENNINYKKSPVLKLGGKKFVLKYKLVEGLTASDYFVGVSSLFPEDEIISHLVAEIPQYSTQGKTVLVYIELEEKSVVEFPLDFFNMSLKGNELLVLYAGSGHKKFFNLHGIVTLYNGGPREGLPANGADFLYNLGLTHWIKKNPHRWGFSGFDTTCLNHMFSFHPQNVYLSKAKLSYIINSDLVEW